MDKSIAPASRVAALLVGVPLAVVVALAVGWQRFVVPIKTLMHDFAQGNWLPWAIGMGITVGLPVACAVAVVAVAALRRSRHAGTRDAASRNL